MMPMVPDLNLITYDLFCISLIHQLVTHLKQYSLNNAMILKGGPGVVCQSLFAGMYFACCLPISIGSNAVQSEDSLPYSAKSQSAKSATSYIVFVSLGS